jgi:hypothetical protein
MRTSLWEEAKTAMTDKHMYVEIYPMSLKGNFDTFPSPAQQSRLIPTDGG